MKLPIVLGVLIATALASSGCAQPRVVRGITNRGDQIKFLYIQGGDTGILKCKLGADGAMSDCQDMQVELED